MDPKCIRAGITAREVKEIGRKSGSISVQGSANSWSRSGSNGDLPAVSENLVATIATFFCIVSFIPDIDVKPPNDLGDVGPIDR